MAGPSTRTHYQVLGVAQGASAEDLRKAHRQLARVLHPDRLSGATAAERQLAERRMREVNAAWTVLSDVERRRTYDRSLHAAHTGPGAAAGPRNGAGRAGRSTTDGGGPTTPGAADGLDELDPDEEPLPNLHFWLLRRGPVVVALVIAAGLFVVTAYAGGGDSDTVRTTAPAQDCVRITSGRTAVPTTCDAPNNGRIVTTVELARDCPRGTKYVVIGSEYTCVDGDAGQPAAGDGPGGPGSGGS